MKEILLVCAAAAIFVFGYYIMKKLDAFLYKNRSQTEKEEKDNSLLLAFDNPMIIDSLTPLLEDFSKKNPDCQLQLFFVTAKEISDILALNNIDFAFVSAVGFPGMQGYNCVHLSLYQGGLISAFSGSSIKPLLSGEIQAFAVWRDGRNSNCKKAFADQLVIFSHKNQKQPANR